MSWTFRLGFGLVTAALLAGCRGSDVVMYDVRNGEITWKSLGTDSDWRECLSKSIDGDNGCIYTLQPLMKDYEAKKTRAVLRAYDFAGTLQSEQTLDLDITYIGEDSFRIYDRDCREVRQVNLSRTHPDFTKEWLGRKYRWMDDATIAGFNSLDSHNEDPVLIIDVRTGNTRQAPRSEFPALQGHGVRVKETLMLKERF